LLYFHSVMRGLVQGASAVLSQ